MADQLHKNVFDPGECLSQDELLAYQSGQLPVSLRHKVEKHLVDCGMCAEAFEGLSEESPALVQEAVNDLTDRAWMRVSQIEKRRKRGAWIWITSSAATILVVVGLFFLNRNDKDQKIEQAFSSAFEENPLSVPEENPVPASPSPDQSALSDAKKIENKFQNDLQLKTKEELLSKNTFGITDIFSKGPLDEIAMNEDVSSEPEKDAPAAFDESGYKSLDLNSSFGEFLSGTGSLRSDSSKISQRFFSERIPAVIQPNSTSSTYNYSFSSPGGVTTNGTIASGNITSQEEKQNAGDDLKTVTIASKKGNKSPNKSEVQKLSNAPAVAGKEDLAQEKYADAELDNNKNKKNESLDDMDFTLRDSTSSLGDVSEETNFDRAMNRHKAKDFTSALAQFETLSKNNPNDMESRLYAGINYLSLNQPANAIFRLNEVINGGNARQKEDAKWYRALAYLKLKDVSTAKTQLKDISTQPGRYQEKAKETLQAIE